MSDALGIYGKLYDTPARGGRPLGDVPLDTFTCDKQTVGGCWSAGFSRAMTRFDADDWYEFGLGRKMKFFDEESKWVWEGFVNKVTVPIGDVTEVRGPLIDIANRVNCTYTPRDFSVYPPVDGSQTVTPILENADSQGIYGIWEQTMSSGTCPEETAIKAQQQFLDELAWPRTTGDASISPGNSNSPVVSVELLGDVHRMTRYVYDNTSTSLSYLSDKLKAILGYDPNAIISTDYNDIEQNLYLVNDLEIKMRYAWDVLSELLTLGNDVNDLRRSFGIYENARAIYKTIPQVIAYKYNIGGFQAITDVGTNAIVRPWNVQPGMWITVPDFAIGRNIPSTSLFGDPRNHFIEGVKFTAPYSVDLSNGQTTRLAQMLAKISYSGGIY